jgi:hypothetical protein
MLVGAALVLLRSRRVRRRFLLLLPEHEGEVHLLPSEVTPIAIGEKTGVAAMNASVNENRTALRGPKTRLDEKRRGRGLEIAIENVAHHGRPRKALGGHPMIVNVLVQRSRNLSTWRH